MFINEFWSAAEAQRSTNINSKRILEVYNDKLHSYGGFRWRKKLLF